MSDSERIAQLIDRYAAGDATPAELEALALLLEQPSDDEAAKEHLLQLLRQTDPLFEHSEIRWQVIQGAIAQAGPAVQPVSQGEPSAGPMRRGLLRRMSSSMLRWSAAALLIFGLATYYWLRPVTPQAPATAKTASKNDRLPGGNIAVLTLSDGSTIVLDSAQNGTLAQQGNTKVSKLSSGQLAYQASGGKPTAILYNTLTTPRGGEYRLTLPDGTGVWLNAASSITYPTAFIGDNRTVSITGEAYFEVQKDVAKPFKVLFAIPSGATEVNRPDTGKVEVLGTHFNINAYADEIAAKTTLLEGSVRVVDKDATLLKPGQQAALDQRGTISLVPADVEEVVAWKNGRFNFQGADIRTVMRQIARWYDVEVVFEGRITTDKFFGEIPRNSKLTEVFKILELSNVHFKVEDRKVIVRN